MRPSTQITLCPEQLTAAAMRRVALLAGTFSVTGYLEVMESAGKRAIRWNLLGTILDLLNLSIAKGHSL
jgi:hypothetical protein